MAFCCLYFRIMLQTIKVKIHGYIRN